MEIYVQSCGKSVEQDYSWQKIVEKNVLGRVEPPALVSWINQLVQKDAFSIFIGRKANQLILSITNIESSKRSDYVGRRARSSILCTTQNPDEEMLIRSIAAKALGDISNFSLKIDQVISFSSDGTGFDVSPENLQKLLLENLIHAGKSSPSKDCRIGNNSAELRASLAKELLQHHLPERQGALVVVTQFQDPKVLKAARIWRGLSSLVSESTWQDISQNPLASIRAAIGGVGILALMTLTWVNFFSFSIKSGDYLKVSEEPSERILLYNQPNSQAKSYQATAGSIIQVVDKQEQWLMVKICQSPRTELRSSIVLKQTRWISIRSLKGSQANYQIISQPNIDCK